MIVSILIYIFGTLISWVAALLPDYSIYPDNFLWIIEQVGEKFQTLNFFVIDTVVVANCFIFILTFEIYLFTAQKIADLINFFRGSGKIDI